MPRFLTPARLCLLVLVQLYQEGRHSSEASLPLLDFLARHILISSAENDSDIINDRNALASCDISYVAAKLQQWTSHFVGRSMYDILLWRIWDYSGLDSLNALIGDFNNEGYRGPMTHPGTHRNAFTPSSPFGQYIRKCWVEYTRLQFDDTIALWKAFEVYRQPTFDHWAAKNPDAVLEQQANASWTSVPPVAQSCPVTSKSQLSSSASVVDADVLLHFAIYRLQKIGTRVPGEIKSKLEAWIGDQWDSSSQSLHFFVAFFEHWRAGQYTMALESLHRYFDYSIAVRSGNDNLRIFYQYALLHLSVLHADFECWDESVDAMNECIATARENQDTACLNFALSWLLHLRHVCPGEGRGSTATFDTISGIVGSGSAESDEIAFLKQKAKDGKHWMLLSNTLLEEAKIEMYSGGSVNRAQEHIVQSIFLSVQHDLRTFASSASVFQGACFERLGQGHLARRTYDLANTVHTTHSTLTDKVRTTCRLAHAHAQTGRYTTAMAIIDGLAPSLQGILKLEQRAKAFAAIIQTKLHLQKNNLPTALHHLTHLHSFRSDPDHLFEIQNLSIEALLKQDNPAKALAQVNERLRSRSKDVAQRIYLLLLKARILPSAKSFTIALRATATAERHSIMPLQFEGIGILSKTLIELGEFEATRELLESALPHALELNDLPLVAQLFVSLGEACAGFAGTLLSNPSEQQQWMSKAQVFIERGRLAYEKTEDLSGMLTSLVMKGKIAAWRGDEVSERVAEEIYLALVARDKEES